MHRLARAVLKRVFGRWTTALRTMKKVIQKNRVLVAKFEVGEDAPAGPRVGTTPTAKYVSELGAAKAVLEQLKDMLPSRTINTLTLCRPVVTNEQCLQLEEGAVPASRNGTRKCPECFPAGHAEGICRSTL